jgi:subtilase family serine protease
MRTVIAATALATVLAAGPVTAAAAGVSPAIATLPASVAPFAIASRALGAVPATSKLTVQFWLTPQAAAQDYATAASTPGNSQYRHFLSPASYTARFGATSATAGGVESWLRSAGFTGVSADAGRDYVRATAPVATIDSALGTRLEYYRPADGARAGQYQLRANDRAVSLPTALAKNVLGVTGLDNAAPVMTYAKMSNPSATAGTSKKKQPAAKCSESYGEHFAAGLPRQFGVTRFPTAVCGYTPQQLRAAYGYQGANSGQGVTVALVEVGLAPDMQQTLQDYAKKYKLQAPSSQRYRELSLGRGSQCGDPFNVEEQMDVEAAYDMAPQSSQLVVGGDSCDNGDYGLQALYDADTAILNGQHGQPLAQVVSNSWEGGNETIPANMLAIEHAYLVKAAAEGVSMLFAAGDSSGVQVPSSDPDATAVGGTTLGIGAGSARAFETGWSTGISDESGGKWHLVDEQGASGGGPSLLYQQPGYQAGVVPAAMATAPGDRGGLVRTVPDISADGDPFTGMAVGMLNISKAGKVTSYSQQSVGGTSLATPLVAGLVADAEQGQAPFGFLNPALYKLAGTGAFHDPEPLSAATPAGYRGVACGSDQCGTTSLTTFDDQGYAMDGYTGQVTASGYDTMTGVGTPDGPQFIAGLREQGAAAPPAP